MLTMLHKPRTSGETVLAAVAEGARRVAFAADAVLAAPFHWAENRRMLGELARMDEHALHDIGVTRGDVRDALAIPVLSDATVFLAFRRAEHRAAH